MSLQTESLFENDLAYEPAVILCSGWTIVSGGDTVVMRDGSVRRLALALLPAC